MSVDGGDACHDDGADVYVACQNGCQVNVDSGFHFHAEKRMIKYWYY